MIVDSSGLNSVLTFAFGSSLISLSSILTLGAFKATEPDFLCEIAGGVGTKDCLYEFGFAIETREPSPVSS